MKDYAWYKAHGICWTCREREAMQGKTRCAECAELIRAKKNYLYSENAEYREYQKKYLKEWKSRNPEKLKIYESRKSEYNRRYRNGY